MRHHGHKIQAVGAQHQALHAPQPFSKVQLPSCIRRKKFEVRSEKSEVRSQK